MHRKIAYLATLQRVKNGSCDPRFDINSFGLVIMASVARFGISDHEPKLIELKRFDSIASKMMYDCAETGAV